MVDVKIEKTKEIKSPKIKMIIFGASGIGKTVMASTAPKPLFLDVEGGLLSIRDKAVDYVKIEQWQDLQNIFLMLKTGKLKGYESVVIDSLTEASKKSMDDILTSDGGEKGPIRKDVPTQHDWLRNIEQTRTLVRSFRDLDMNVVFTCLSRDMTNEMSGGIVRKPAVSSKSLSDDIPGYVDIVAYLDVDKDGGRWAMVQPSRTTQGFEVCAKDRSGVLDKFEKPDIGMIIKKVSGEIKPKPKGKEAEVKKGGEEK